MGNRVGIWGALPFLYQDFGWLDLVWILCGKHSWCRLMPATATSCPEDRISQRLPHSPAFTFLLLGDFGKAFFSCSFFVIGPGCLCCLLPAHVLFALVSHPSNLAAPASSSGRWAVCLILTLCRAALTEMQFWQTCFIECSIASFLYLQTTPQFCHLRFQSCIWHVAYR